MQNRIKSATVLFLICTILITSTVFAGRRVKVFGGEPAKKENGPVQQKPNEKLKPFKTLIKDKVVIDGLFTFYKDTADNSFLMALKPEQVGPIYLCGQTRSQSEGVYFDNGSMGRSFPFYFKIIGNNLLFMEKNLRFRADSTSTLAKALERGISDHLFGSTNIMSIPDDSTGAILVDPTSFFIRDIENIGFFLGRTARMGIGFDQKNSYFKEVKAFPENTEIDVKLHFQSSQPLNGSTMQNPYSMFHTFHYSLSTLPETDYTPRVADDRIGHFQTLYQDYSTLNQESNYVRYISRWNLKKKNPEARISEPVEPIVYWVENTVPLEYRDAVAEGIEFWNKSFEKIGFRNAIIAKQMPDTADWDPADVRYSTVRWIVNPGGTYAVGPSRANPFTGQIYDADVRICVDFIRYMFLTMDRFISPVSETGKSFSEYLENIDNALKLPDNFYNDYQYCNYGSESAKEGAFGMAYLLSNSGDFTDLDSLTKEYVYAYLVELVAHEVGHTLGFRHNFKASTIKSLDQINDRSHTTQHGTIGTVMEYAPPNIAGPGKIQGEFYSSHPGPYDDWIIEYAYSDFGNLTTEEEIPNLQQIASRVSEPGLAYGTDNDAFGRSPVSVDPKCNLFDLGDDPLAYCEHKVALTQHLWKNTLNKFENDGERYQKLLKVFQTGWRSYSESGYFAAKHIGGLYNYKNHIGDKDGQIPFVPVSAAEQKRAMNFINNKIFAADVFTFPADLLNRLQPDRSPDFEGSEYNQVDYDIHDGVLNIQRSVLYTLYNPYILNRLINNQLRYEKSAEIYTMSDMFSDVRNGIWKEINAPANVNSFRRQLQLEHINLLVTIYLGSAVIFPHDARALAANDLDIIENTLKKNAGATNLDGITKAHFKEILRQIDAARGAKREFLGATF